MRWIVTLSGSKQDTERLAAEIPELSRVEDAPRELLLELDDPEGDDAPHAAKAAIDASVRRINGFARLRWGWTFEGVSVSGIKSIDPAGRATHQVFIEPAVDHMLPEDYADMVERLGHPRPELPAGLDVINALEGQAVTTLAATNPEVARVLHLVNLMLEGNDEIDWVAGHSALEVIEQDLRSRGLEPGALGWWTNAERKNFTATANSVEVLGFRARHGRRFGLTEARMTSKQASWLIRRAAALWVTHLLAADGGKQSESERTDQIT